MRYLFPGGIAATALAFLVSAGAPAHALSRPDGPLPAVAGPAAQRGAPVDTAVFAGGCFWGVEAVFEHVRGVVSATSGYAGGGLAKPSYEDVSSGSTGHAESVLVVYDPSKVSYEQLLQVFFAVAHDPTQLDRQGPDQGTQYRSAIFFRNPDQQKAARGYIAQLEQNKVFPRPIVTQVAPLETFYQAEAYHQDYLAHHPYQPYIVVNDAPKLKALQQRFPALYQERG